MASTSYNTLTLSEEEPRKARSSAVYVILGLAVVAMAGAAAVFATGAVHAQTAVNAEFSAKAGSMATCDKNAADFLVSLPKYDPILNADDAGRSTFYNACYYAFRCCTTSSTSCMRSEHINEPCQTCLKENAPRMVQPWCYTYASKTDKSVGNLNFDSAFAAQEAHAKAPTFDLGSLKQATFNANGDVMKEPMPVPSPEDPTDAYKAAKAQGTCWPQPGMDREEVVTFAKECFDVISWCNLLCPRDGGNSNQHAMCKHCVIMDFQKQDPTIDKLKDQAQTDAGKQAANEAIKVTTILSNFTAKYK